MIGSLVVNGLARELPPEPQRRLIDWLRDDLGLTGTKEGCGTGHCGACSVLVDDEVRLACCELVQLVDGAVTTVEALEELPGGSALIDAFVSQGAIQCGFCTPAMLLAAWALPANKRANRAEVRLALAGNVCRCTGYEQIMSAVASTGGAGLTRREPVRKLPEDADA